MHLHKGRGAQHRGAGRGALCAHWLAQGRKKLPEAVGTVIAKARSSCASKTRWQRSALQHVSAVRANARSPSGRRDRRTLRQRPLPQQVPSLP